MEIGKSERCAFTWKMEADAFAASKYVYLFKVHEHQSNGEELSLSIGVERYTVWIVEPSANSNRHWFPTIVAIF